MASSTRRSRLPGARLWLGLLLLAGWSAVEAGAGPSGREGPDQPQDGGPEVLRPPRPPLTLRRLRDRGAGLTLPLAPSEGPADGGGKPGPDPDDTPSLLPLPGDRARDPAAAGADAPHADDEPASGPICATLADADRPFPAPPLALVTLADANLPSPAPPVALAAPPVPFSNAPAARSLLPRQGEPLHRDPVEPPVTPLDAWRELVLSVTLNGRPVSDGTLFAEDPRDGRLAIELATLQLWRVQTDVGDILTFEGQPYYPLDRIPGTTWKLDRAGLSVAVEIPPERFASTLIGEDKGPTLPPAAGRGAFLDYDFLASAGDDVHARLDGLAELGTFTDFGTLTSSVKLDDLTATPGVTRLDTTFTRDLPDRRTTLRVGDSVTGGGAFAFPVRFAGVQYGTNFGTDPAFVPFPLPTIGGLARQESAVDLLINNLERVKSNVPAGPFSISNLPVVTGSGEVQLRVTDLLGRQQVVTQPYYVSSRLLKPGLHDFSYEAGFERKHYGDESFDYGQALAAATERYGFSDHLTGEAHAEAAPDQQSVAAGGSYLLGRWGVVTTGAGVSQHHAEAGGMVEVGYEYEGRRFNFGARTRAQTSGFAQIGEDDGVTRTDQLNLGFDLGRAGSLGVLFLNREADRHDEVTTAVATYSHPLGPGLVSFRAAELVRPDSDLTVTAAYVLPLGTTRTVSTEVEERDGDVRGRVQYHQGRGASDLGLDYRLGADVGTGSDQSVDARLNYQTRVGTAEVDAQQVGGSTRVQGDVNGSVTLLDGHVGFSRQVGRAFGLVALPGYPNVRVYVDNREAGRTDQSGYLLLPGLRPYEANKVKLAVADLPIDAQLKGNEVTAVPFDNSGVRIGFDLDKAKAATAILRDTDGHPLPAGLALASADGGVKVTVAKNGFAQVDGIGTEPAKVEGAVGSRRFACEIPAPRVAELLPDLGEVTCR